MNTSFKKVMLLMSASAFFAGSAIAGGHDAAQEVTPVKLSGGHLYMDIHRNIDDLTAAGLHDAHQKDLEIQEKYGVTYHRYWFDEDTGTVFCLVESPSKEAAALVHQEAHGLVADELIEVDRGF
jgi:hypothetical protein